jgi:methionine-R-sulfoxide reductase
MHAILSKGSFLSCLLMINLLAVNTASAKGTDMSKTDDSPGFQKPTAEQLKAQLSPQSYQVTQHDGTEQPFKNAYWDNKAAGLYVDVVSGEPLFSSTDKFDSGTGWPSFTKPIDKQTFTLREDRSMASSRIEVRSKLADSHLGHLFDDGPAPTGKRYCMNSAAMRFVPVEQMATQGYGHYLYLFASPSASPHPSAQP